MIYISHMCFSRKLLAFWSLRQAKKTCRMKYIWIYRRRGVDPGFVSPYEQKLGCVLQVSLVPNWSSCCLWISISSSLALRVNGCPFVDFHWLPDGSETRTASVDVTLMPRSCVRDAFTTPMAYALCGISEEETAKRCIEAPLKIIDLYILTQEEKNGLEWFWVVLTLQVVLNPESSTSWKFCSCKDHLTGQGSLAHPFPAFDFEQPSCLNSTLTAN